MPADWGVAAMQCAARFCASSLLTVVLAAVCLPSRAELPPPETEPVLKTADFKGLPPLTGAGYRIDPSVPVSGYLGKFTVKTDLGDVVADGIELLHQRVNEVKAVGELDKMSTSDVFVKALGQSASQGAQAVGQAVEHPVDTLKNVPSGIGRLFGSFKKDVSDTVDNGSSGVSSVSDSMGVGKARRQLAHKVGVDPYTSNPLVSKRLDSLSKAAFAGGVSIDVVFAVASGGAATAVSFTRTVSNLAWELPPEDIRARNQTNLAAMGVAQPTGDALLNNTTYTPTLALAFVEALKALDVKDGSTDFTQLAAQAATETEARFYIDQLRMAGVYKKSERIERLDVAGKIGVMRAGDRLFVPVPVDYLSWTEGVRAAVESPKFEARERVVWLTGEASRRAHEGLRETRWTVREHAPVE
jgi:hypothetical protein